MSKQCLNCGNNPVSHKFQWINQSMIIFITPFNIFLARIGFVRFGSRLFDGVFSAMWWILEKLGAASFHSDINLLTIDRAKVLWEEAIRRGIKMENAVMFGRQVDFYRATVNSKQIYFTGLPRPKSAQDTEIEFWVDDKAIIKEKLSAAGVPVPAGGSFSKWELFKERFQTLQKPVIVKPRLGSRGRHTTTFIYNEEQLREAWVMAKQLCHWVIIEEHLTGAVYRGTMIGGKLAGVLGGSPPNITGDGIHTIQELVALKDAGKDPRQKNIKMTPATMAFLARNGLAFASILPAGKTIDMTEKIGLSYGGTSFEITEETHPEIKVIMEKAAAVVGDPLLGFDFIIPDVTKSPADQKWGIIECNGVPFINLHHDPLIGKPNNVAKFVWDLHVQK
jgi:D-alanine-D-alanine ligase-like ATP-grasp enzyme